MKNPPALRIPEVLGRHQPTDLVTFGDGDRKSRLELEELAVAIAGHLGSPEDNTEVLVLCRDKFLFAAALLGAWRAGYQVGLPPNSQPETIREIRSRDNVRTVLHDGGDVRGVDVRKIESVSDSRLELVLPTERELVSVYTSGSTGSHRRFPKTTAQLLGEAGLLSDTFGDVQGANVLSMVPAHHIYGLLFGLLVPLVSGGRFRRTTARGVWEVMEAREQGADILVGVPALLGAFRNSNEPLPLKRVFSSGAPLHQPIAELLHGKLNWTITEVLGSTETGGIGYRLRGAGEPGPYQPFSGLRVSECIDQRLHLVSPLVQEGEFTSEDLVRVADDGTFEHLGRADGVIKVGSTRVSIKEVEGHLLRVDGVRDAAVLGQRTKKSRGTELWAIVESDSRDEAALRTALRKWLSPLVIPRRFRFVDKLPRTDRGKIRRAELEALFEG